MQGSWRLFKIRLSRLNGILISARWIGMAVLLVSAHAHAWDDHPMLMPWVLRNLPASLRDAVNQPVKVLCPKEELAWLAQVAKNFELNEDLKLKPLFPAEACTQPATIRDILLSQAVQEPDWGMDRDLPENRDPTQERKWMGGISGPNSQGFRHMFFGGLDPEYPLRTFQLPIKKLGQAPTRAWLFAEAAREYFKKGENYAGARLLAWSLHYIQDLGQPYHTVQVPHLKMVEWRDAAHVLPRIATAFSTLIDQTSRTIGNYHYAYEKWVSFNLRSVEASDLKKCLDDLEFSASADQEVITAINPDLIALEVAQKSRLMAWELAEENMKYFGNNLRDEKVNLPLGYGAPDYPGLQKNSSKGLYRKKMETISCDALERSLRASRRIIEWAL